MKIALRIIGVVLVLAALLTMYVNPVLVTGPAGTALIPFGVLIDAIALAALLLGVWTWRRAGRAPA